MGIVDEDVARVRDATDMVGLVTQHLQLKKVGSRWVGLCPFHAEKTPSFSVNAEEGLYYCFGCLASGDAITFVREIEHVDFPQAVEYLAQRAGITLRYTSRNEGEGRRRRAALLEAVERAVDWYNERLLTSADAGPARAYLRERGLDGDIARRYRIGWAPAGWDVLAKEMQLPEHVFRESGLGFVNRRNRRQDTFRARVLFPIFDVSGAAVGFGGRILPGGDPPKYLNSSDSEIYNKSKLLYGLNWAKEHIVKADEAVVCEGYTDVIGFDQVGLPRAVATCGTALTEEHFRTLKRFARRVVLAFDADAAGQAAAERLYEWERAFEIDVAVAQLPPGGDPADLARSDPEGLRKAVEAAQPFLAFRVERVMARADLATAEGRARAAERAAAVIAEHPSSLVRDQYLMSVADRCRVDIAALRRVRRGDPGPPPAEAPPPPARRPPRDDTEVEVLRLIVHRPEDVPDYVDVDLFGDAVHRAAFDALLSAASNPEAIELADGEASALLQRLVVEEPPETSAAGAVGLLVEKAAIRRWHAVEAELRATADLALSRDIAALQTAVNELRLSSWRPDQVERLVDLLRRQEDSRGGIDSL